jgi:hypothetical protein
MTFTGGTAVELKKVRLRTSKDVSSHFKVSSCSSTASV